MIVHTYKTALMMFDDCHVNLKYKYGSRQFWCYSYYVDTAGKNEQLITKHIRNQLLENEMMDQVTMKE